MKKPNSEPCEIEARCITYTIPTAKTTTTSAAASHPFKIWNREDAEATPPPETRARHVLNNVSCRAKPSEILAIVGPSGAGKSTLLEVLAGRLTPQHPASAVLVNGRPVSKPDFQKLSGYVTQRDTLFPLLTVHETLAFSARLRLGLAGARLARRVESLVRELGLDRVAEVRVGDGTGRVRGISGGERRRVSIGVEAVHDPRVLILDEPTSGLDSTSAAQIVEMVRGMCEASGRTVVMSIHQPGSRIVKMFGSVLVLAGGTGLYHGSVDRLGSYLGSVGLEAPVQVNVVEFAIDSIEALQKVNTSTGGIGEELEGGGIRKVELGKEGRNNINKDRCTLQHLFLMHKVVDEESAIVSGGGNSDLDLCYDYANSRLAETAILTHRFLKNVFRTRELFACRTITMLVSSLVLGSIFYNLKDDKSGAGERVGLFAFILTFLLSCTTEALPIFLQEREILMKETTSGSYRVSSYVIANGLVFLPFLLILAFLFSTPLYFLANLRRSSDSFAYFLILIWLILYMANSVVVCFSALVPNFIVGNSVISGVMGSFFLFSGYFISKEGMPSYWVFMHYVSLFKYPFEGLLVNEFGGEGRCLERGMGVCVMRGDDLLREEGLGGESKWRDLVVMVGFILGYRFFSYVILRCRFRCAQKGGLKRALVD